MADHVVVPARNLVRLGDVHPVHAAPLTDAGMTALHAVERARRLLEPAATAVVVGIGGLGHLAVRFLRATSRVRIIAADVQAARLDFAADLGADAGVVTGPEAADAIRAANGGRQADVVLDFVGAQATLDLAAAVTRRGGAIVVTGGGGGQLAITARMGAGGAPDREVELIHTFGGTRVIWRRRSRSPVPAGSGRRLVPMTSPPPAGRWPNSARATSSVVPCSCPDAVHLGRGRPSRAYTRRVMASPGSLARDPAGGEPRAAVSAVSTGLGPGRP